jgi:hypothetical protein
MPHIPEERTGSRTKHNLIISPTRARKCACCIILRVTVSILAPILEKFGKSCRSTTPRIATVFISFENGTRVVTPARSFQLIGALPNDISGTSYSSGAPIRRGTKIHRNIKPINKRHVKEIQVLKLV